MTGDEYEQLTTNSLYQNADDQSSEESYSLVNYLENIKSKLDESSEHNQI